MATFYTLLLKTSLIPVIAVLTGCGQTSSPATQGDAALSTAAPHVVDSNTPLQTRFVPIKPDLNAAKSFQYKVYEFASDGSWISIVPMPPKAGDIEISISQAGNYVAKLTNEKCAYPVVVTPANGSSFTLTSENPTHPFAASANLLVRIAMANGAKDNYFCNTAVATSP